MCDNYLLKRLSLECYAKGKSSTRGDGLDGQVKGRCSRRDATSFEMTRQDLRELRVYKVRLGRDKMPCIA